jgi:hypothetical protein
MFIFGARVTEVKHLQETRQSARVDERFTKAVNLVRYGHFGWADYFAPIVAAIDVSAPLPTLYLSLYASLFSKSANFQTIVERSMDVRIQQGHTV